MIKRFILAVGLLAVVALGAFDASAAMTIRQNSDGTASHIGSSDLVRFGNCVGGFNLQFAVPLNKNVTAYSISPATNAVIKGAYAVSPVTSTGTAILKVYANNVTTPVRFSHTSSTSLVSQAIISISAASAGTTARISTVGEVSGSGGMIDNRVGEGDYIAVGSDGGATVTGPITDAIVSVQLCPR